MGMKRTAHTLGMMMAMSGLLGGGMTMPETPRPRYRQPERKLSNPEILALLKENKEKLSKLLQEYSDSRPKGIEFEIQGFEIKAINEKNAVKAVRSILAQVNFKPDITLKKINNAIWELERRIEEDQKKTINKEYVKSQIVEWATHLGYNETTISDRSNGDIIVRFGYWRQLSEEQLTDLRNLSSSVSTVFEESHEDDDGDGEKGPIIRHLWFYRVTFFDKY